MVADVERNREKVNITTRLKSLLLLLIQLLLIIADKEEKDKDNLEKDLFFSNLGFLNDG